MFGGAKKRYTSSVIGLLPGLGVDTMKAGPYKVGEVIDTSWARKQSEYEAALVIAYSYVSGIYKSNIVEAEQLLEKIMFVQNEWVKRGAIKSEVAEALGGFVKKLRGVNV
ncbi:hypothetical protein M1B72_14870 [Geomonas paludis]|uniref:Uncharacterized protein n=1 Tax=Geomonas paludis TaxID=2740185 RepID=A0ABY4LAT6_9BACT|nr:hypothetical protein [Geomonas paludis]UPU34725.1 hypothetical protein M1B72_14870 [Geomonas paludis]